uniref:Uncharacterized protein n=1 Tax=Helianthus annuus TaxID=4232 RepID=A0A251S8M7_HELAN
MSVSIGPMSVWSSQKEFLADEGDSRVRKNRMTRKTKMTRSRKRRQKLRRVVLCVCVLLLM